MPALPSVTSITGQAPPPYEADADADADAAVPAGPESHPSDPPPAFQSRESTLVAHRPAQPAQPAPVYDYGVPVADNGSAGEKEALAKGEQAQMHEDLPDTQSGSTTLRHDMPPTPRSRFRHSMGLRGSDERALLTQQRLAERREAQSRMGPSAADAQARVRRLKEEAMRATAAAGPRVHTDIFRDACSTDLLFLIDATGSMWECIQGVKSHVKEIVQRINRRFLYAAEIRVALVGYRDHNDEVPFEVLDFTTDTDAVFRKLDRMDAIGGDDIAEDVLGGIDRALKLSWKHQTRCIMHFADAPPHGECLNYLNGTHTGRDSWPNHGTEPHGLQFEKVITRMAKMQINYVFFRLNQSCDKMVYQFMDVYSKFTPNLTMHPKNGHIAFMKYLETQRAKRQRAGALSDKDYLDEKLRSEGGIYMEETSLDEGFEAMREKIISGVLTSSSRTAVRLSTTLSTGTKKSTYPYPKKPAKPMLNSLSEDTVTDSFTTKDSTDSADSADSADDGADPKGVRGSVLDSATTVAETIVEEEEDDLATAANARAAPAPSAAPIEFETSPPLWSIKGWLDDTATYTAYSPDIVDHGRPSDDTDTAGPSSAPPRSMLTRMIDSDDHIGISVTELTVSRRTRPFAQGALRLASYARTQASTNPLVIKTFKQRTKRLADLVEDMRIQALCKAFALEYNSLINDKRYALDFIVVTCLQPKDKDTDDYGCLSLEPMLGRDRYVKYNNNCGGIGTSADDCHLSAQAFSHYTFERSRGAMLVCDLQGVGSILTDPAVHTRDPGRFVLSDTNLGEDGIKLFFTSHTCNQLCKRLRLQSTAAMFVDGKLTFRTDWPAATSSRFSLEKMSVCCANKLCGKIVVMTTAKVAPPGFYWCNSCWPQLKASTVRRVCPGSAPGAFHEFDVSCFFYESQGQLLPTACRDHGGQSSHVPTMSSRLSFLKKLTSRS